MKRLTVKKDGKYTVKTASSIPLIINRLAEYENTEEQIANKFAGCIDMKTILDSFCAFYDMQETNEELAQCTLLTNEDVMKYRQWKDAEEQGLLLRLPCKVGDTIYLVDFEEKTFDEATVNSIEIDTRDNRVLINSDYEIGTWSEDNHVFYSKEEAEQALARMEESHE